MARGASHRGGGVRRGEDGARGLHAPRWAGAGAPRRSGGILSGGPRSVYSDDAPDLDAAILDAGVPVLGICYGLQWLAQHTGGEVLPASGNAEYGRTELEVLDDS